MRSLPSGAFATPSVLFILAALMTSQLPAAAPVRRTGGTTLASLFSGFAFVYSRRLLLGVLSLDLFAVLFGGAVALLPIYARDILMTGPWGLGILRAAPALGALSMSVVLARFPLTGRRRAAAVRSRDHFRARHRRVRPFDMAAVVARGPVRARRMPMWSAW